MNKNIIFGVIGFISGAVLLYFFRDKLNTFLGGFNPPPNKVK